MSFGQTLRTSFQAWVVFVAEIDEHMLSGKIDLAVHSMKDLPTKRPGELTVSAILKRDSSADVLVSRGGLSLDELKEGSIVGTSSMRRTAQLRRSRPICKCLACAETCRRGSEN